MQLTYGAISLDIVKTNNVIRQAIYSEDGCDYLYTYWRGDFFAVMNPSDLMAYNAALQVVLGTPVPTSDIAIRHPLLLPRLQLTITEGRTVLLSCPANLAGVQYATDADNGPFPLHFNIEEDFGDKTNLVRYIIECRINECPKTSQATQRTVVLSQRWTQVINVDEDHYSVRITDGLVIFRSDELLAQALNPDQLRGGLGHPVPENMQRYNIRVVQESDKVTYRYHFEERELPFNLQNIPQGLTRIEAYETRWFRQDDYSQAVADFAGGALSATLGAASLIPGVGTAAIVAAKGAAAVAGRVKPPSFQVHIFIRVWGNRTSQRQDLAALGLGIVMARLPEAQDASQLMGKEISLSEDLMGKWIEIQATMTRGPNFITIFQLAAMGLGNTNSPAGFGFPADDRLRVQSPTGNLITTQVPTVGNPIPPNSIGTRGTNISVLIAQALGVPCIAPPPAVNAIADPPTYVNADTRSTTSAGQG
jgi:hypothetical protein